MSPNTCSIQDPQPDVGSEEPKVLVVITPPVEEAIMETEIEAPIEISYKKVIRIILPRCDDKVGERRDSVTSVSTDGSGILGDAEEDKSEESSDCSSDVNGGVNGKELAEKIVSQVEAMFTDEHLTRDAFLLKHVRRRCDGFVSLKLVAGLRKVKQISRDYFVIRDALRGSNKLEVNVEGTKVRRVDALPQSLKSAPIKAKDETQQSSNNATKAKDNENRNHRHSSAIQGNDIQNQNRRKNNRTGSNNISRNNSFSKAPAMHPADLFRNAIMMSAYSSSGEDSLFPQVGRRRGGSLPITVLKRNSAGHLTPSSSPPNGSESTGPSTMSPWLQRRKAASAGELSFTGVIRQPKGPDGTKGFAPGYRAMIIQERLQQQTSSTVSV